MPQADFVFSARRLRFLLKSHQVNFLFILYSLLRATRFNVVYFHILSLLQPFWCSFNFMHFQTFVSDWFTCLVNLIPKVFEL